ncbi:hypothetical protein WME88_52265 [Sorangium sp. So ce216]
MPFPGFALHSPSLTARHSSCLISLDLATAWVERQQMVLASTPRASP